MKDDTREELERIEKELLAQEAEQPEQTGDVLEEALEMEFLREDLAEPAFEDMDEIRDPEEPLVYCNYSNDYGRDLQEPEDSQPQMTKDDKVTMGLMIAASALALGIIIVMIYWLVKFQF